MPILQPYYLSPISQDWFSFPLSTFYLLLDTPKYSLTLMTIP